MRQFLLVVASALLVAAASANVINKCSSNGLFSLTIDDGPADFTKQLLGILDQKKVKATFHLSLQNLTDPTVQSLVKRISSAGHLIGIRTEPEWNLMKMTDDQLRSAVARQSEIMHQFIGYYPKLLRLPYRKYDDRVLKALESAGAIVTMHNLESYDYSGDSKRIVSAFKLAMGLKSSNSSSFISIQHDSSKNSVTSTPEIIDAIKASGYKIVRLDECIGVGDLTKNKTPLKGGKGGSGSIPTLDVDDGKPPSAGDDAAAGGEDGKKSDGFLKGLGSDASTTTPRALVAISLMLLAVLY